MKACRDLVPAGGSTSDGKYLLVGPDRVIRRSHEKGALGGNKNLCLYGRLECSQANRYLAQGHYAQHRVFFASEEDALRAGFRPCGQCLKPRFKLFKELGEDRERLLEALRGGELGGLIGP